MNLLEQYIVEIHEEKPYEEEWTAKYDYPFVWVDVTTDCYGSKERVQTVFTKDEWETHKKNGYFWG